MNWNAENGVHKNNLKTMVSDIPRSEQTSERSEQSKRGSEQNKRNEAEHGGANDPASWMLWSKRVALLNDAVFSILDHSVPWDNV